MNYFAIWVLVSPQQSALRLKKCRAPTRNGINSQPQPLLSRKGRIVRVSEDQSILTIRGGPSSRDTVQREVLLNSATRWTKVGKPAEQSEFKEGSYVIVVGKPNKGRLEAINIDLRPGR